MRWKLRMEQGFTLIEVVVSIVIITVLVATFAPLIVSSVQRIEWAGKRAQTMYNIRGIMERNMALGLGEEETVMVKGPTVNGSIETWEVPGNLVHVHEIEEDEKIDEFLVSFVMPKE